MIKVLIAEDEYIIREGIKNAIDWEKLGFIIVGEADDGEEALEMILELHPEVLITDIHMPFMNGIDLQKKIKELNLAGNIYTVVISGYNDFGYAQSMLNYGAFAYLLKPIDVSNLENILTNIKDDYTLRIRNAVEMGELNKYIKRGKKHTVEYCLYMYLNNAMDAREAEEKLASIGMDANDLFFAVMVIEISAAGEETVSLEQIKRSFKLSASQQMFFWIGNESNELILVIWNKERENAVNDAEIFRKELSEAIKAKLVIRKSEVIKGLLGIKSVLETQSSFPSGSSAEEDRQKKKSTSESIEDERTLLKYSEMFSFESKADIKRSADKLAEVIAGRMLTTDEMFFLVSSIIFRIFRLINQSDIEADVFLKYSPSSIITSVMAEEPKNRMEALKKILFEIRTTIDDIQTNFVSATTKEAKAYIEGHYKDEELDLCEVAHYVSMSVSYFSVLFKREEGISFSEYLTEIRLTKAKEILSMSNYRAYEVSNMVGYSNATYFSTSFKKRFGVTPTEYRKSLKSDEKKEKE